MSVLLTIVESNCRSGHCLKGDSFLVEDLCPPICHELWSAVYPQIYALLNGGDLDRGETREAAFEAACPDGGRVRVRGERIDD